MYREPKDVVMVGSSELEHFRQLLMRIIELLPLESLLALVGRWPFDQFPAGKDPRSRPSGKKRRHDGA